MGWILRTSNDLSNPTLAGGIYGRYITAGRPVYYLYNGSQTSGIIFIGDGGRYGLFDIDSVEYKGSPLTVSTQWKFHPGTLTKQISPKNISAINVGTDTFTSSGHGFSNGDLVRVNSIGGDVPAPLSRDLFYAVEDVSGANFRLYSEDTVDLQDLTNDGSGQVIVYRANAGFDDPDQGLPSFCPEVATTLSNIAYIEFRLPIGLSSPTDEPDWADFRIIGSGRKLMNYNSSGADLGVVSTADDCSNVALQIADNAIVNYKVKTTRVDWASLAALKTATDVHIWQSVLTPVNSGGAIGRYYSGSAFNTLVATHLDTTINYNFGSSAPFAGVSVPSYSIRWTAWIKPEFSEVYTFTFQHDDSVKFFIDGTELLSVASAATSTIEYLLTADQFYQIVIEQTNAASNGKMIFQWQSASRSIEVVPTDRLYPSEESVRRYECHIAFPSPTEASEVHERLMDRVPGWDWTDDSGLIKFLAPDRAIAFAFAYDKLDDDSTANFVKNTLIKRRRPLADRKNFLLGRYRNVGETGYPFAFVQADREALRRFTNGEPSNDPADDLGVCTRSLASRVLEMQMILKTDPDHVVSISGGRASSKLRKAQLVTLSYYDEDGNYVANARYIVTFHAFGAKNEKNDFNLTPLATIFYTDEPVV